PVDPAPRVGGCAGRPCGPGRAGPGGELVLLYELFATNLNRNELQTVLINFVSISQVWSVYVTGEGDEPAGQLPSPTDMLHLGA
ncbi:MAG: hypothetical protein RLZ64_1659, partial [Pseudomonadota bacterium]